MPVTPSITASTAGTLGIVTAVAADGHSVTLTERAIAIDDVTNLQTTLNNKPDTTSLTGSYVTLTTNQTVGGNKNFTGNTTASTLTVTGNTAIGGNLNVTGTVTSNSQIYSSDKRLKENIIPISDNDIMKVADIELKSFNFIKDKNKIKRYGIIAQDAEAVGLNELVKYDENGMRGIDYIEFLLLKVAQLEEEIKELKNK